MGTAKTNGSHSDDFCGVAVYPNQSAENVRGFLEMLSPHAMTDDGHKACGAGAALDFVEGPALRKNYAETFEIILAHGGAVIGVSAAVCRQRQTLRCTGNQRIQGGGLRGVVSVIRIAVGKILRIASRYERDKPLSLYTRGRFGNEGIEHRINGCVSADHQCNQYYGRCTQGRRLPEDSAADSKILCQL